MSTTIPDKDDRVVLILVGLVASGKSTFAEALQHHFPQFRRCNQDELGDRRQVERLARESLRQGLSVSIDRTNFNAQQRSHWISIAREFSVPVWVIVFDTPYQICVERLRERKNHPTITDVQQGLMVLARFRNQFEAPSAAEGYDRIVALAASDRPSPQYTLVEISAILERLRQSLPESYSTTYSSRGRGGWRRTGRGARSTNSYRGQSSSFVSNDGQSTSTRRGRRGRGGSRSTGPAE